MPLRDPVKLTDEVHAILRDHVHPGDVAVDATAGNGHDTVALARLVGPSGHIYAFDIQSEALESTQRRLVDEELSNVTLVHASHARIHERVHESDVGAMAAVAFNLGYLPNGDHTVTTLPATTVEGVQSAHASLRPGGVITVLAYVGHEGGLAEAERVERALDELSGEWIRRDPPHPSRPRLLARRRT